MSGRAEVASLWSGVLGPPVAWALRIGTSYVLVPYACRADGIWLLHTLTLAALGACGAFGWLAWRLRPPRAAAMDGRPDLHVRSSRVAFMARLGVLSSALFALVIVAEGTANVMLDPCSTSGPLLP